MTQQQLRRSSRIKQPLVSKKKETVVTTDVKVERKNVFIKQENTETAIPPEDEQSLLKHNNKDEKEAIRTAPPKDWNYVYDLLAAYREKEKAPVDTMGCERLADQDADPKVQRFQTLVSLMLSSQTKDTVTSAVVRKLQASLKDGLTLRSILQIDEAALDNLIQPVGFHTRKASYLKKTAIILRNQYDGDIPDTLEGLTSLPGVGPKMAFLTLQVAWNKNDGIGVDVHVHRISNRLGWCKTTTPEATRASLQSWLPKDKWKGINPLLVGFGQIVCLPRGPRCNECPVSQYCPSSEIKTIVKRKRKVEEKIVESVHFKKEKA